MILPTFGGLGMPEVKIIGVLAGRGLRRQGEAPVLNGEGSPKTNSIPQAPNAESIGRWWRKGYIFGHCGLLGFRQSFIVRC